MEQKSTGSLSSEQSSSESLYPRLAESRFPLVSASTVAVAKNVTFITRGLCHCPDREQPLESPVDRTDVAKRRTFVLRSRSIRIPLYSNDLAISSPTRGFLFYFIFI